MTCPALAPPDARRPRAGHGAGPQETSERRTKNVSPQFIDATPMTAASAKFLQYRLDSVEHDIADLDAEIAAMFAVRDELLATASRYRACLLPPSQPAPWSPVGPADEPGQQQPVEAQACEAAKRRMDEQQHAGRDPYGDVITGLLPQAPDHVHGPATFDPSSLGETVRIAAPDWTGPAASGEDAR